MSFPRSDHCNGKTFFYPGERVPRGLWQLLRWKLTSRPARWPAWVELAPQPSPPAREGDDVVATWVNHATFLLQTPHGNFLTDPVFSRRCSPVSWAGPQRVHAPGVAFGALPKIDVVLLSHDHFDHCDLPSLQRLAATHRPVVIAPLGHAALLAAAGVTGVVELDWWQTHPWAPGLDVTLTPSRHWCRRRMGGTNHRLWGGFHLKTPRRSIYFLGDSGYDASLFRQIHSRLGPPDLAMIPIGAYEPRWFMQTSHLNPAEAVQGHHDLGARLSVAMHWGTFQLTDEARDAPVKALQIALAASSAPPDRTSFRVIAPAESVVI